MQLTVQSHIEQTVIEQTLHDCFQLQRKSFHQQGIETHCATQATFTEFKSTD